MKPPKNFLPIRSIALGLLLLITIEAPIVLPARQAGKGEGPVARLSEAPPSALRLKNPLASSPAAATAGAKLFRHHCSQCHGTGAKGSDKAPGLEFTASEEIPPGALFWAIRNGRLRKGMPSWAHLPDPQIWQIVTYLKTLSGSPSSAHHNPSILPRSSH